MIALHPIIAHFPVALLITSVILDALGVGFRRASLTQAGFSTLVGGGVGAALGALTGPEGSVRDAAAIGVLHRHELFVALTILLCLVLIGLRLWRVRGLAGTGVALYLTLAAALVVTLTLTGYYGGQLTYEHGVGVARVQKASAPAAGLAALQEVAAKLGGLLILLTIPSWALVRRRFLWATFVTWRGPTDRDGASEHPQLCTLALTRTDRVVATADEDGGMWHRYATLPEDASISSAPPDHRATIKQGERGRRCMRPAIRRSRGRPRAARRRGGFARAVPRTLRVVPGDSRATPARDPGRSRPCAGGGSRGGRPLCGLPWSSVPTRVPSVGCAMPWKA